MTETKKHGKLVLNRKTIRKLIVRSGVHTGSIAPPQLSAPNRSSPLTLTCNGGWTALSLGNEPTLGCDKLP